MTNAEAARFFAAQPPDELAEVVVFSRSGVIAAEPLQETTIESFENAYLLDADTVYRLVAKLAVYPEG